MMRNFTLLVVAGLAGAACGGRDSSAGRAATWKAQQDTLGDTIVVRTVGGSAWGVPASLVQRMSIGVADGDETLMLGDIRGLAVARDGSVYFVESGPLLKKFGPDGAYIRTFGRVGSGPGEYRRPDGGLAVLPDGRVVLRDPGNGRLAVFSPEGEPLATWRISSSLNTSRKLYSDTAGNVYTLILFEPDVDPDEWRMGLLRFGPDGTPGDSAEVPEWRYDRAIIKGQAEGNTNVSNVPFSAESHWTFSPLGYFVGGASNAYRIDVLRPGSPVRIERQAAPVPVQGEEGADERRAATDNMRRNFPGWVWNGPDVPATKPPFRDVFTGEDGRIWVLVSRPGVKDSTAESDETASARGYSISAWSEPAAFDVFEPNGRYLGEVSTPRGFLTSPEPVFRGDTVWAVVEDTDGVHYVRRFELVRAASAT